jgi:monoamine oxidase
MSAAVAPFDVIVVGAGLAGARIADLLSAAGRRVLVLEARDRVGGRLWSDTSAGATIDRGGQWIGPRQSRVVGLAAELGLTRVRTPVRGRHVLDVDGVPRVRRVLLPPVGVRGLLAAFGAMRRLDRAARVVPAAAPWDTPDAAALDAESARVYLGRALANEGAAAFLEANVEGLFCRPLGDISALELLHQLGSVGGFGALHTAETWFLAEGAQRLVTGLIARSERAGVEVRRGHAVARVEDRGADVLVECSEGGRPATFVALRVVLAVPPQLRARITVDPPLPTRGMPRVVTGDVIKLVAVYEQPWWRERGLSGLAMTASQPIAVTIDSSRDAGSASLVGLASSRGAAALRASRGGGASTPEDPATAWLAHTRRWLAPDAPPPFALTITDWTADPWALGGYAARPGLGGWTEDRPDPAPIGRLHFAGTETARAWRSYMEGALESAERVAGEVLQA